MTEQAISPSATTPAISPSVTTQVISPLRQRMIEDMSIRKFTAKTQHDYVQRVKDFATFFGRSPGAATSEEVRRFRLHLASCGAGTPTINATCAALRFFFKVTLDRPDLAKHLTFVHEPRKIPVVLSPEEVARFLEAAVFIHFSHYFENNRVPRGAAQVKSKTCIAPASRCGRKITVQRWKLG
jgi:hypothetical protein